MPHSSLFQSRLIDAGLIASLAVGCSTPLIDGSYTPPAIRSGTVAPDPVRHTPPTLQVPAATEPSPSSGTTVSVLGEGLPHMPARNVMNLRPETAATYHEVQAGETIAAIAKRYETSTNAIQQANGLDPKIALTPGQMLFIPPAR